MGNLYDKEPKYLTRVIVVILEVEEEEGDEACDQADDSHGDVVDQSTPGSTAPHLDKFFFEAKIMFQQKEKI